MFTGIIKKQSKIKKISELQGGVSVWIARPDNMSFKKGESVAVSGICSTVLNQDKDCFKVFYMPETLSKTTVPNWKKGLGVNLEQSLKYSDLLSGHIVQGHVDCRGVVKAINKKRGEAIFEFKIPKKFSKFVLEKGSVAIDGVSLTVFFCKENYFKVSVTDYTLNNTALRNLKRNDEVNIEVDVLGKYFYKFLNTR